MTFAAVIFDMDGLLLETEQLYLDCFLAARQGFGLDDNPTGFLKCVGLHGELPKQYIRDSLNGAVDYETFNDDWDARIAARLKAAVPVKPGAAQLIETLAAKGLPMGVATSTKTDQAVSQLDRVGLLPHFKCVIGGDLVKNRKPDPEIYLKVAGILGADIAACVAFEDSASGTQAAVASGAKTVQVPDLIPPSDELKALGHVIAPSLLDGAVAVGLTSRV